MTHKFFIFAAGVAVGDLLYGHIKAAWRAVRARRRLQRLDREQVVYRTASGRELTDADIQALADEAERGYDVTEFLPREYRDL